jgi:hypothetical protein
MRESLGLLIKAVDGFGFLSEDFGMDLVSYEYNRRSPGNFKIVFEHREVFLSFTLERGQLFIHVSSVFYPDEWHSMLRLVRHIARKGGGLTHEDQDTDYWRNGLKIDSQFALASRQLERTLGAIIALFSGSELETTRSELKSYNRTQAPETRNPVEGRSSQDRWSPPEGRNVSEGKTPPR